MFVKKRCEIAPLFLLLIIRHIESLKKIKVMLRKKEG
jgi:hypothetical protein